MPERKTSASRDAPIATGSARFRQRWIGFPDLGDRSSRRSRSRSAISSRRRLDLLPRHGRDQLCRSSLPIAAEPMREGSVGRRHPMIRTALDVLLLGNRLRILGTAASGEETLPQVAASQARRGPSRLSRSRPGGTRNWRCCASSTAKRSGPGHPAHRRHRRFPHCLEAKALKVEGDCTNSDPPIFSESLEQVDGAARRSTPARTADHQLADRFEQRPAARAAGARAHPLRRAGPAQPRNRAAAGVTEGTVKVYLPRGFRQTSR